MWMVAAAARYDIHFDCSELLREYMDLSTTFTTQFIAAGIAKAAAARKTILRSARQGEADKFHK